MDGRSGTRIAVIPGDGVGLEIVPVAVELIQAAVGGERTLEFETFPWSCRHYLETGTMMPDDGLEILRSFDAIFLGAIGDASIVPDHVSLWEILIRIRRGLGQSLNVRPAHRLPGVTSPLGEPGDFDILVIRENTEGEYSQVGGVFGAGPDEGAMQVAIFTRRAIELAIRHAFEQARSRRRSVVGATKSNGITHTMPFWDRVFREVSVEYPEVTWRLEHIDALAARFVTAPASLDVVVASNLFGDILSELSSAIMGSIGVAPSANVDPLGVGPSMFEPVHGSAPDIAGKGIANPTGQIWSGVMLLESIGLRAAAHRLMAALEATLEAGDVTADLGGKLGTQEMATAVERRLVKPLRRPRKATA